MYRPPQPPLSFRIGFVGHRPNRLIGADPLALSEVLETILEAVKTHIQNIWDKDSQWYSGEDPALQAISSLAEGSDRLFAEVAIKLGFSLTCPMPFPQEEYEVDFDGDKAMEPDSVSRFRQILDRARDTVGLTRFQISGDRKSESPSYRVAGKTILNQSDLLFVLWDGNPMMAVGGTEDILREALRMNISIVWIDARAPHGWMVLADTGRLPAPGSDERYKPTGITDFTILIGAIDRIIGIPGSDGRQGRTGIQRLTDFYAERYPRPNPAILWKLFGMMLGKDKWSSIALARNRVWEDENTPAIQGFESRDPAISRMVRAAYTFCDRLSGFYADFYRSGYILSFLLAALAVGLALFPLAAGWLNHGNKTAEAILVTSELFTLLGILVLVYRSRKRRWHSRWLDYRLAAEWIRQLLQLAPLGMGVRVHETRGHHKSYEHPASTWMAWYVKAMERSLGLPDITLDTPFLLNYLENLQVLTNDQLRYHAGKAESNHLIEKRLHRTGVLLIAITIAACSLHLLPLLIPGLHWSEGLAWLLTFLCGFLPAFGAAIAGINNQGEFKRLAKTSESMQHEYGLLSGEINALKLELCACDGRSLANSIKKTRKTAYRISQLMIDELSDWRITYHNRPIDLPV
jgi:hypothetical protein